MIIYQPAPAVWGVQSFMDMGPAAVMTSQPSFHGGAMMQPQTPQGYAPQPSTPLVMQPSSGSGESMGMGGGYGSGGGGGYGSTGYGTAQANV